MSLEQLSLLDTDGMKVAEWWVVYHERDLHFKFLRWVKRGFNHCELVRPIYYGPGLKDVGWLFLKPMFEMMDVELSTDPTPPWDRVRGATAQKVIAMRPLGRVRSWWDMGPPTCVEAVKWALGVRAFAVRTPYQLFNYIQKRSGVLISGR